MGRETTVTAVLNLVEAEIVIPPGEVCDKCNGQRLQRWDNKLAGWPPISVFPLTRPDR